MYLHTLFYPNTRAEINSEVFIGLSAGQSLSINHQAIGHGHVCQWPRGGKIPLAFSLSFNFLQMDAAAFCAWVLRGSGWHSWVQHYLRGLGKVACAPLLKPCLMSSALNPMLFVLSRAKELLLMRFSRLTVRLSCIAAIDINDSYMARPTSWLWKCQLLPVCACLLESTARSYKVAGDAVGFRCCRS